MKNSGNTRVLDRLVADGQITREQAEAALNVVNTVGERVEEALLEIGAISEQNLLRFIATLHQTRFVSTEKLAKAEIDRFTLERVPKKLAEHHTLFPVLFDAKAGKLSVVIADPDNAPALHELQLASGVREVIPFVARPRAIKAAIAKAYNGDIHAFANLDRSAHEQFTTMLDVFERNLVSADSVTGSLAADEGRRERLIDGDQLERGGGGHGLATEAYLETMNVLISLIENGRADLRGHSAHVARLLKKLGERIGLSEVQIRVLVLAGYLHDLGKMGPYHLTALNVAQYEGHQSAAKKAWQTPVRLLETVTLPAETLTALNSMYERFDGTGFPKGERGKEIPLGARILSIADTYADLTQNPRNPYRKTLKPAQGCEVLARYRGTVFDPNLVDLFRMTVTGDDLKARLLANRYLTLVVDPDPEESTMLELRLIEQGFEVRQARTAEQALKALAGEEFQLVISEVQLEAESGLRLMQESRKHPWGQKLVWIFVSGPGGRAEAQRAFEAGASDFMVKPVSPDVLVAKAKQTLEKETSRRGTRGVSGSLKEMSLPDMVQVLWHGRKSGTLKIRSGQLSGELHFVEGSIFNAMWDALRGSEAFYAMLALADGEFSLDPNATAGQRVIHESPEALLLEGMRRMDEAQHR